MQVKPVKKNKTNTCTWTLWAKDGRQASIQRSRVLVKAQALNSLIKCEVVMLKVRYQGRNIGGGDTKQMLSMTTQSPLKAMVLEPTKTRVWILGICKWPPRGRWQFDQELVVIVSDGVHQGVIRPYSNWKDPLNYMLMVYSSQVNTMTTYQSRIYDNNSRVIFLSYFHSNTQAIKGL